MADTTPDNCLTVGKLIELLRTYDPALPVSGYRTDEATGFVSEASVTVEEARDQMFNDLRNADGTRFVGLHVNIMGD